MKWYKIENKTDKAEIWLYDEIGEDWWTGGGVTAKAFQKEISAIKAPQIDLHINSPGGSVFDGVTIYNLIKQHPANVTTYIDGIAASIASVIALAGDRVVMAENAIYMIHSPSGGVYGKSSDMRSFADVLDKINGTMVGTYVAKTGKPEDEISAMLDTETWLDADEALEAGFIDEISGALDMAACARFVPVMAKMGYRHIPENIVALKDPPSPRTLERALRDVGLSSRQAKKILAEGLAGTIRDEAEPQQEPEAPAPVQRDVAPERTDRVSRLLAQAEVVAPSL
jgi:ATP-dependent Clp endopeptidase proteolytic subunit ClpP